MTYEEIEEKILSIVAALEAQRASDATPREELRSVDRIVVALSYVLAGIVDANTITPEEARERIERAVREAHQTQSSALPRVIVSERGRSDMAVAFLIAAALIEEAATAFVNYLRVRSGLGAFPEWPSAKRVIGGRWQVIAESGISAIEEALQKRTEARESGAAPILPPGTVSETPSVGLTYGPADSWGYALFNVAMTAAPGAESFYLWNPLDGRTGAICRALAGRHYPAKTVRSLASRALRPGRTELVRFQTVPDGLPGLPPYHPRCRSVLIPSNLSAAVQN